MFDRNDPIFSCTATRFGVSERAVEALILSMLWAGERALGRADPTAQARSIVRRTIGALRPGGDFSRCIQDFTDPPPKNATLAVCTAAHRLCLWIRAHDVEDDDALANYFETAVSYYVEFWRNRSEEEVTAALGAFESTLSRSRAPKSRSRRSSSSSSLAGANVGSGSKAKRGLTSAVPQSGAAPQTTTKSAPRGTKSIGTTAPTRRPDAKSLRKKPAAEEKAASDPTAASPTDGSQHASSDEGSQAAEEKPAAAAAAKPESQSVTMSLISDTAASDGTQFASSLDIDLALASEAVAPRVMGKRVEMACPLSHPREMERPGDIRWIVLGKGRALTDPPRLRIRGDSAGHRPTILGAKKEDTEAAAAATALLVSDAGRSNADMVPTLFRDAANLLEDDTDESGWWTRRYDAINPDVDSDFEPEHSEGDPASDIDDDALEESTPNTATIPTDDEEEAEEDDAEDNDDDDDDDDYDDDDSEGDGTADDTTEDGDDGDHDGRPDSDEIH